MSTETLAEIWGLYDPETVASMGPQDPSNRPSLDETLFNDCISTRWACHNAAELLTMIPSSEDRLLNEGMGVMYDCYRRRAEALQDVTQKRGLSLPSLPAIPVDWREEAAIDSEMINTELLSHLAGPMRDALDHMDAMMKRNHWTSHVAANSVMADVYIGSLANAKKSVGSTGGKTLSYVETLVSDETLAPYCEALCRDEMREGAKVIREEILRCRSEAEKTGWKEHEAKDHTLEQVKRMAAFFGV